MRKQTKVFLRAFCISSVILSCLIFGFWGISKAYENIRLIGFGEYRTAIDYEDGKLKIFDFEVNVNSELFLYK